MHKNSLVAALENAAEELKAERYMSVDPRELTSALVPLTREVAYHLQHLEVFEPEAIDAFRKHQNVGIPDWAPSSAEVLLTGPLQVFMDSLSSENEG